MIFTRTEPTVNFPILRFVSESGRWELGWRQMIFGRRVSLGRVGNMFIDLDYCAGADLHFQMELLATVKEILEFVPEDISPGEISTIFPSYQTKPINLDPCWDKLQAMLRKYREGQQVA